MIDPSLTDKEAELEMEKIKEAITEIRTIRAEHQIEPKAKIEVWINIPDKKDKNIVKTNIEYIKTLVGAEKVEFVTEFPTQERVLKGIANNWELAIPIKGLLDWKKEILRLKREIEKIENEISRLNTRLNNPQFRNKAPSEVVSQTEKRIKELKERQLKLEKNISSINFS